MKTSKTFGLRLMLLALFVYSCDIVNNDSVPQPGAPVGGNTVYTLPKSGAVMDLLSMSGYENATGFSIVQQPGYGSVGFIRNATLLYTPDTTQNVKFDYFLLKVSQGDSVQNPAKTDTVVIRFVPRDSIPCAAGVIADSFLTGQDEAATLDVLANDRFCQGAIDSSSLKISEVPAHGQLTVLGSYRLRYTPKQGYNGYDFFMYRICNLDGQCGEAQVKILVGKPVLVPPQDSTKCLGAVNDSYETYGTAIALRVLDNDAFCGSPLDSNSIVIVRPPSSGTLQSVGSKANLRYTPQSTNPQDDLTDSFVYRICTKDGNQCAEATVKIVNRACRIILKTDSLTYRVPVDSTTNAAIYTSGVSIKFSINDQVACAAQGYKWSISQLPVHGTVSFSNDQNVFIYKAAAGYKGRDVFEYAYCPESNSQCNTKAKININIE